ncbi:TPA: hypothetical protein ACGC44_001272, partial [Streptococcus pneumoniae]
MFELKKGSIGFNFSILPFACFYFIVLGGGILYFDVFIYFLGLCTFYTFKNSLHYLSTFNPKSFIPLSTRCNLQN